MRLLENMVVGFLALAPLAFIGAAVAIIWFGYIGPAQQQADAVNWIETPCTITSIKIDVSRGVRNRTEHRSMNVVYQYQMSGRDYESTRYQIHGDGFGAFEDDDIQYVEEHPAGSTTVCYVDPNDHSSAVLLRDRKLGMGMALMAAVLFVCGIVFAKAIFGFSFTGIGQRVMNLWPKRKEIALAGIDQRQAPSEAPKKSSYRPPRRRKRKRKKGG